MSHPLIPPSSVLDHHVVLPSSKATNHHTVAAVKQSGTSHSYTTLRDTTNSHTHPTNIQHTTYRGDKDPENDSPKFIHPPLFPSAKTKRDRMFELEISNQSHSILLLRNELNNKDIEIVELKGQLQDIRIKMERQLKEKEKQIRDKNIANSSLREELEMKMQMISTLQKEVSAHEVRHQQQHVNYVDGATQEQISREAYKRLKEKDHEIAHLQQERDAVIARKNAELHSLHQKLAEVERQQQVQANDKNDKLTHQAEVSASRNTELEAALRQAKSRITSLEAELAVVKAESANSKSLLVESEKAVTLLRKRTKTLDSQLREMESIAQEVQRQQDMQQEMNQVHTEKVKLRALLDQKTALVSKKEEELAALQEQTDIYQEDFRVKSELVNNLEIRLKQREAEIESLKGEVATLKIVHTDSNTTVTRLESMVAEKDKEVGKLSTLLQSAYSDVASLKAKVEATSKVREDLLVANAENTRINILLQQANVDIALQSRELETLEQQVKQLSSRPTFMNQHVEELEQLVDQQSNTLAGLHDALAQRDTLISFFESEIGTKEILIKKYKEELEYRDSRVRELEEDLKKASSSHNKGSHPPSKNVAHLEAQIRNLEAEQVRYRAEIKNYQSRVDQMEAAKGWLNGKRTMGEDENGGESVKEEAVAVAAELTSLRVLIKQAGKDSSAFSALRESELGARDWPRGDDSLHASLATIRAEAAQIREAVTRVYAESVGSECAVQ